MLAEEAAAGRRWPKQDADQTPESSFAVSSARMKVRPKKRARQTTARSFVTLMVRVAAVGGRDGQREVRGGVGKQGESGTGRRRGG